MGFVLFHYTLFVLLGSILTSATCLSAYLVSRKRTMLYASFGFLFYFFDVAWVFQRDFFTGADAGVGPAYALIMSLLMVLAGCGFLTSFWLLVLRARCIGGLLHFKGQLHGAGVFSLATVYCQIPCHCQAIGGRLSLPQCPQMHGPCRSRCFWNHSKCIRGCTPGRDSSHSWPTIWIWL